MYCSKKKPYKTRFFEIEVGDGEKSYSLAVENPKLRIYQRFEKINNETSIDEMAELIAEIITKNRQHIKIDTDFVLDNFDVEEMADFFEDFAEFIGKTRAKDPN